VRGRLCFGCLTAWAVCFSGGCGDGAPAPRGFGSYQVAHLRDASFAFFGYGPGMAFYETVNPDDTRTQWELNAETGTVQPYASTAPTSTRRFYCASTLTDSGTTIAITDTVTGVETDIDRVSSYSYTMGCPRDDDLSITVWRRDDTGHLVLWTGRYDDLQPVPLALLVDSVLVPAEAYSRVTAEQPDAPGGIGIYDVANTTYAVTEIVPPTLKAAAWAEGATPAGPLASSSIEVPANPLQGIQQLGDWIFYLRTMSDGGRAMFASPVVPSPSGELALFRVDPGATLDTVAMLDAVYGVPTLSPAWQHESATADLLYLWDAQTQRIVSCPGVDLPRPFGYSNHGGRQFIIGTTTDSSSGYIPTGALLLVSPDGDGRDGTCTRLADADAHDPTLSTDGALAWLVDGTGESSLWTAAPDGTGARLLGQGLIESSPWAPYFYTGSRLELRLDRDLAWLDVHDDPVKMHYVADQVFDRPIDFDTRVLIGYEYSEQDGTGSLGLIERASGAKRLISTQVVTYLPIAPSSADSPVRDYIVYLVRGRNPSPQDGLWVATITKDDVQ
jgi:hypothetical protein